ncbi:helix-turn-helix domain-containing protein [Shouchella lehensis]|uniref:HTH-type transcriptional regulator n=1 Tax=Shouchella lehensis G1 TaxID=1246626 RepID=A0A060M4E5_9BACI|nr:helix-turn-helix transcriptional regulator [Shouchella lehensis]AIC95418.1 HTH-type transcriptional regulator [Shouchella lehensis G1]
MKRLADLRYKHNLTQEQLSKLLSVSRNTYANYELGVREMDYSMLVFLADYYKVSLDYILGRTDNPIMVEQITVDEAEYVQRSLELYRDMKGKIMK